MRASPVRLLAAFAILFLLYQSAEGIGARMLGSFPVPAGLMVATAFAAWPLGRWLGYRGYDAFGLDLRLRSIGLCGALLLSAVAAKALAILIGVQAGVYAVAPALPMPSLASVTAAGALLAISTFIPSIAEDILTRGFFLRAANPGWSGAVFVLGTALLFVANHIYRFDAGISEQVRLFAVGTACAAAAWKWQTLWGAVGLHWGYNLSNGILGPLVSDLGTSHSGRWITTGVHLGLLAVVLLLPRDAAGRRGRR